MRRAAARVEAGYSEVTRGGTHQARLERDAAVSLTRRRLAALELGDRPLVFGRLDLDDGTTRYVGRVAVDDEQHEPLVIDWRAPAAAPFYQATPGAPMGVVRRRHFQMRGREVVRLDDELLDAEAPNRDELALVGEGALLDALERRRTGRMGDIVATIQADQDRAIRAAVDGVSIITGGPGTGKTAVALHRAAYLLYTERRRLARRGVLFLGPSPTFLRYVEEVLPALGETEARLATAAGLRPTVRSRGVDPPAVATLKGDARMAAVVAAAVRDRERHLPRDVAFALDGHRVRMTRGQSARIVDGVRRRRGTHNARRPELVRRVLRHFVRQYRKAILAAFERGDSGGGTPLGRDDLAVAAALARGEDAPVAWEDELRQRIRQRPEVREVLERMWPVLSGRELLRDTFGFRALARSAARGVLERDEVELLLTARGTDVDDRRWSNEDVALVDEADALLGPVEAARPRRRRPRRDGAELEAARRVVEDFGLGSVTARDVAARYHGETPPGEDPGGDTELPTYGHVLVDEAQDLSAMEWRMVGRRGPQRSMTVVGDVGQSSAPGAVASWDGVLQTLEAPSATVAELRVNYRTPAEIVALAAQVLAVAAPEVAPPTSVRSGGSAPRFVAAAGDLVARVADQARGRLAEGGTLAVVADAELHARLAHALGRLATGWGSPETIDAPVALLTPTEAKGLEFDHVVVAEPSAVIGADADRGMRRLYVVLTRATRTLSIVHEHPLPPGLGAAAGD